MSSPSKPHIVLIHGAWHSPETWDNLRAQLTDYQTTAVALPSIGATPPHVDSNQDTAVVRTTLSQLIENEHRDVILVLHSYGAIPGSNACEGLLKVDRPNELGGVVHVIYLAAFMLPVGTSLFSFLAEPSPWIDATSKPGYLVVTSENALSYFYNGMARDQALECVKLLRDQSLGPCADPVRFAPWPMVGATYVGAESDEVIKDWEVEKMVGAEGWCGKVVKLKGHHCLYVDQPEVVAKVIKDVVKALR